MGGRCMRMGFWAKVEAVEIDDCGHHLEEGDGIDNIRSLSGTVAYQCGMLHVG